VNGSGARIEPPALQVHILGAPSGNYRAATPTKVSVAATGEFKIPKALPGVYGFDFEVPEGSFLSDIRQGDRSIKQEPGLTVDVL